MRRIEETIEIASNVEKQPGRLAGGRSTTPYESKHVSADDILQRRLTSQLREYYDQVIASIGHADSILILGPGEAKGELKKRLESDDHRQRTIAVQTADKMTDREIAARVREYFRA